MSATRIKPDPTASKPVGSAVLRKGMVMGNPESSENTMNTPPAMAAGPTHRIRTEIFIRLSSLLEAFMPPI